MCVLFMFVLAYVQAYVSVIFIDINKKDNLNSGDQIGNVIIIYNNWYVISGSEPTYSISKKKNKGTMKWIIKKYGKQLRGKF